MANRIVKKTTPEQAAEYRRKLAVVEAHRDELLALGRKAKMEQDQLLAEMANVFKELREERKRQGLSLADIADRTGMSREAICRLENLERGNFQIQTIQRYAKALGFKVNLALIRV